MMIQFLLNSIRLAYFIIYIIASGCNSGTIKPRTYQLEYTSYSIDQNKNMSGFKNEYIEMKIARDWEDFESLRKREMPNIHASQYSQRTEEDSLAVCFINLSRVRSLNVYGELSPLTNHMSIVYASSSFPEEQALRNLRNLVPKLLDNAVLVKGPYRLQTHELSNPVFEIYSGENMSFDSKMIIATLKSDKYRYLIYGQHTQQQAFQNIIEDYDQLPLKYQRDFLSMLSSIK